METWILDMVNRFGYLGIAGLIAFENIFPPIPSEVILTFGGLLTTYSSLNIWLVIVAATLGSMIGAIVLYGIGGLLPQEHLKTILAGKTGRILHLHPEDVDKSIAWFQSKGKKAVFFCRFIPMVRSLISIPAGASHMDMGIFLLLTLLGSIIWNTVLIWLGAAAGVSMNKMNSWLDAYSNIIWLSILFVLTLLFIKHLLRKRLKKE